MGKGLNPVDRTLGPKTERMYVQLIWSLHNSLDQTDNKHQNQRTEALQLIDRYVTEYQKAFGRGLTWTQVWQKLMKGR